MFAGVKIIEPSAESFLEEVTEHIDFIEVMAVLGNDYSFVKSFSLPVVIHNMHFTWGVNFVNPKKAELNRKSLDFSLKLADEFSARRIIVHPERFEDESCSETEFIRFLSGYNDERIIIESMPYEGEGCRFFAYDYASMKRLLSGTGKRMCLDFAHSSEAAVALKREPVSFIRELIKLNPVHYHLSDTKLGSGRDMHIRLREGDLPIDEYIRMLPKDAWVTLETPHDAENTKKDVEYLKRKRL
jgi:endonuclease IV